MTPSDRMIEYARQVAKCSPCAKSKRGAIVCEVNDVVFTVLGSGFNGTPGDIVCDGSDSCRRDCGKICMHAESRAIANVLANASNWKSPSLSGAELVHVKVVDGQVVAGGPPSCWQCSKMILDVGIGSVWLYEDVVVEVGKIDNHRILERRAKWQRYTAKDFHLATLNNCNLHGARP